MIDEDRLASIAQQLAGRVRDDVPLANGMWLASNTTEEERWALLFVLAAAVPVDVKWSVLTNWTHSMGGPGGELRPHGTSAAVSRHQYRKERMCDLCKAYERQRIAKRRAA